MVLSTTTRFPAGNLCHMAGLWAIWDVARHIPELGDLSARVQPAKIVN